MRSLPSPRFLLAMLLAALLAPSCQKALRTNSEPLATHTLTVKFRPMAGASQLAFGNNYQNIWGEQYSVSAFRFYISHLQLINSDSGTVRDVNRDEYFLVNFADSATAVLQLKAIPGTFDRLGFLMGVDSLRNVSGAQTGALDPAKGMFWTWNTGYIMAKLEGNSPASTQVNNKFEYHIGGFAGPDNVLKQLELGFPNGQDVVLQPGKSSELTITADANAWFSSPNDIKLSVNPVCVTPGSLAKRVAENYYKMFTITHVVSE